MGAFTVHGKSLNGKLTCGENIADLVCERVYRCIHMFICIHRSVNPTDIDIDIYIIDRSMDRSIDR